MNRTIRCVENPQRIVSLVPSQTELLYHLGLTKEVVGITKFCIHPKEWFESKTRIGGTKSVDFEKIEKLNPDLIIANKEENQKEEIEKLAEKYPVWISDIYNLNDAIEMISAVGDLVNKTDETKKIVDSIQADLTENLSQKGSVLYAIWRNPWMFAGNNVFINTILNKAGFDNVLEGSELLVNLAENNHNTRYPELDKKQIQTLAPDYVFLSSEPYPFKEKHIQEIQEILPKSKIVLVDGEIFSWYGSRLLEAKQYFEVLRKSI